MTVNFMTKSLLNFFFKLQYYVKIFMILLFILEKFFLSLNVVKLVT